MSEPQCIDCEQPLRIRDPQVLAEVIGFAKQRSAGGQNHVRFRRPTGRYLCGVCAVKRQYGTPVEQQSLFR